jgi:hypothetical protein
MFSNGNSYGTSNATDLSGRDEAGRRLTVATWLFAVCVWRDRPGR